MIARRKRDEDAPGTDPDDRAPNAPAPHLPTLGMFEDPLLEAMAVSARANGRGIRTGRGSEAGMRKPPDSTHVATWVKRLDADMQVMADLQAAPSPPPHRRHEPIDDSPRAAGPGPTH